MAKQLFKNTNGHRNMMKNKLFALISMFIILTPMFAFFVSALEDKDADYLIKQYSVFDIKRNCINNGSWCSSATICNITIVSTAGDGLIIANNTRMTNQGSFHNITLNGKNTSYTGFFQVNIICDDNGQRGTELFYYKITPTGAESNTQTFVIIGVVFSLIIAFGYLIRNEYVVFIGGMTALISGVYGMIYGFGNIQNDFTRMLSLVIIGIGIIFTIQPAYSLVESGGETGYEEVEEVISE